MKYNLNFGTSVLLNLPVEKLDLSDWIVNFSCEEYVACTPASRSHKYSGLYRDADGDIVIRNDEYCGGFMMTQFYRPKVMTPHHVRLESRTKARFSASVADDFPSLLGPEGGGGGSDANAVSLPCRRATAVHLFPSQQAHPHALLVTAACR